MRYIDTKGECMMWHVRLSLRAVSEDMMLDALEALDHLSPVASLSQDGRTGSIAVFVEADSLLHAAETAHTAVVEACGDVTVAGLEARPEGEFFADLDRPLFPPVVGYAEIAKAAGVSRQRIRQLAATAGFPAPVIKTAAGPLFPKAAAEQWARTRQPKAGRPKQASTS
ncbi:MAG: hypothetical protein DI612_07880 [Streptococcus thermophilus]|nr:MAG: hypothetical protein DI612_07880 [Streptococcus thermophilus]